jgi:hypothetical protein
VIGVWGRAVLLLALFFAFLAAPMAVHDPDGTPAVTAPEPVPAT